MTQLLELYTVTQLFEMYEQKKLILRNVDPRHVRKIRNYILEEFEGGNVFLPPVVASKNNGILNIIDGNGRLKSFFEIIPLVKKMELSDNEEELTLGIKLQLMMSEVIISFQVYEGLDEKTRDQIHIDLNTKGKKVALSKRIAYDSRNMINVVTNEILQQHEALHLAGIEEEKTSLNRPKNKKFLSLSQLRLIVSLFLTGKETTPTVRTRTVNHVHIDQRLPLLKAWLDELFTLHAPETIGDYEKTILANFTMVKALAYYALNGEQYIELAKKEEYIRQRMRNLRHINWASRQSLWGQFEGSYRGPSNLYFINKDKKTLLTVIDWLVAEGGKEKA